MGIKRTQLIEVLTDPDTIDHAQDYLQTFKCCVRGLPPQDTKPHDVETWLHNQAINFENRGLSRTFLLIDTDTDALVAYFTLAQKILTFGETATVSSRLRHVCGIKSGSDKPQIPCILLAQLGKNDNMSGSINLARILDECLIVVKSIHELIGGNVLLVECDRCEKLRENYEAWGFKHIQDEANSSGDQLHQLYKILKFK